MPALTECQESSTEYQRRVLNAALDICRENPGKKGYCFSFEKKGRAFVLLLEPCTSVNSVQGHVRDFSGRIRIGDYAILSSPYASRHERKLLEERAKGTEVADDKEEKERRELLAGIPQEDLKYLNPARTP